MQTKLRGKPPTEVKPKKPALLVFGPPGAGKTWGSLEWPSAYFIDVEGGATRAHYTDRLAKAGAAYFGPEDGSQDFETVLGQIVALSTEKHQYKTLVIDSVTKLFNEAVRAEQDRLAADKKKDEYGLSKKPAVGYMRRLVSWLGRLDMNSILIAHERPDWGATTDEKSLLSKTFDCWDKTGYELDLTLQLTQRGDRRMALIRKSRLLKFPQGEVIPWDYSEIAGRYGQEIIERESEPVELLTAEQSAEITHLLSVVRVEEDALSKFLTRAGAESLDELSSENAAKLIAHLTAKIPKK